MNAPLDAATFSTGTRAFDYMKACLNSTGEPVDALWCHAQVDSGKDSVSLQGHQWAHCPLKESVAGEAVVLVSWFLADFPALPWNGRNERTPTMQVHAKEEVADWDSTTRYMTKNCWRSSHRLHGLNISANFGI
ncbi:hypothetical protein EJ06DRAFT_253691 [Trichodelitschia bisporula]|uniref:Uncharacterized protein n=1 Tax=Trichodelitschia bisporula TaxID=703511 RepID=A0A6G1HJD5_9PEZI|nr:hypothetical protein EJ06DRAFT_253691 [Trichodelitschia bisporula]